MRNNDKRNLFGRCEAALMNMKRLCLNCMKEKPEEVDVCPFCGFNNGVDYTYYKNQLPPFTVLNERYIVGHVINTGGLGIVYYAKDVLLDIVVAVKELLPAGMMIRNDLTDVNKKTSVTYISAEENIREVRRRFIREARIIAGLSDINGVVNVLDLFEENDTDYIVMEYLEGINLEEYLKKNGPIPYDKLMELLQPVFTALKALHRENLIHGDISPDNIMWLKSGQAKLLDFGSTKNKNRSIDKSKIIQVKKGFSPPEQYSPDGEIGPWTDIYSLCATIYRCITGDIPAEPVQKLKADIIPPSGKNVVIPRRSENALMRGLETSWEKRTQRIEELELGLYGGSAENSVSGRKLMTEVLAGVLLIAVLGWGWKSPIYKAVEDTVKPLTESVTTERHDFAEVKQTTEKESIDSNTYNISPEGRPDKRLSLDRESVYTDAGAEIVVVDDDGTGNSNLWKFSFLYDGKSGYAVRNICTRWYISVSDDSSCLVQGEKKVSWAVTADENGNGYYIYDSIEKRYLTYDRKTNAVTVQKYNEELTQTWQLEVTSGNNNEENIAYIGEVVRVSEGNHAIVSCMNEENDHAYLGMNGGRGRIIYADITTAPVWNFRKIEYTDRQYLMSSRGERLADSVTFTYAAPSWKFYIKNEKNQVLTVFDDGSVGFEEMHHPDTCSDYLISRQLWKTVKLTK